MTSIQVQTTVRNGAGRHITGPTIRLWGQHDPATRSLLGNRLASMKQGRTS
jgi:hypothetical protein